MKALLQAGLSGQVPAPPEITPAPPEKRFLIVHWLDPAYAAIKARLFEQVAQAELRREPMPMPRIAGA